MASWIRFEPLPRPKGRKTDTWNVATADGRAVLGQVMWFARWRAYAFLPLRGRVFEKTCLRDLADFVEQQTAARREARRRELAGAEA